MYGPFEKKQFVLLFRMKWEGLWVVIISFHNCTITPIFNMGILLTEGVKSWEWQKQCPFAFPSLSGVKGLQEGDIGDSMDLPSLGQEMQ